MTALSKNILLTIALYPGVIIAFLLADQLSYRQGANDMSPGLEIAAVSFIVITFFFFRSIYQAIRRDKRYWICVGIHLLGIAILISQFMV